MTDSREMFTSSELEAILNRLDVKTHLNIENVDDVGPMVTIECELDGIEWELFLGDEDVFYSRGILTFYVPLLQEVDPFRIANSWNEENLDSTAIVLMDADTNEPFQDDDGNYSLQLRQFLVFVGHVSEKHIEFLFHVWIENLLELMGDDDEDDVEVDPEETEPVRIAPTSDLDLLHEILRTRGPLATKELAKWAVLPKHDVNHLIYMHLDEFQKHPGQPPKWTSLRQ